MYKNLFFLLVILAFYSCGSNSTTQKDVLNTSSVPTEPLPATSINYTAQLFLIDSLNPKLGYGYNILIDGKIFVHQPSIPSIAGNKTFSTQEKATLVANLVVNKLQNNIMPPSVSQKELDSLHILTP